MTFMALQSARNTMTSKIATSRASDESQAWMTEFQQLFDSAVQRYQSGVRGSSRLFNSQEADFLASIGASASEIYDFVEDFSEVGEPPFETILAITTVRYDYFVQEQERLSTGQVQDPGTFPSPSEQLGGIRWLPRIIAKARAKLKGELPSDLMYGCGADRPFLKNVGIAPEDFLKTVWEAGPDDDAILTSVQEAITREDKS